MLQKNSERQPVEQPRREAELNFHQLAETLRAVFYISDLHRPEILYVSPAYEAIWGRTCASLYQNPLSFTESILPRYRAAVLESLQRQRLGISTEMEYPIQHPDGSTRWIRDRAFPVCDAAGKVCRVIGMAEDITAYKETTAALSHAHQEAEQGPIDSVASKPSRLHWRLIWMWPGVFSRPLKQWATCSQNHDHSN